VLNVAGRIAATEAEGPGVRYALWLQGCPLRCEGCCNPGMLPFVPATSMSVSEVVSEIVATPGLDGVTLLGGEPFAQAEPLAAVARAARDHGLSVLVFSGYTLEELRGEGRLGWNALLAATDVLVDGRFEARSPSTLRFVGSSNQRVHALTARGRELAREFESGPDVVEVRIDGLLVTVNGTPGSTRLLALRKDCAGAGA
jgi:anaerobic ribonucleoside-triphosphate reductase activating protein